MRLDKYLKVTRIIKRRTVANDACDAGKVTVNGKVARASLEVKVGDVITVTLGNKPFSCEVTNITEYVTKDSAADNYRVLD
jgi:ribosomal 50S subunit-recycling heat shock protein